MRQLQIYIHGPKESGFIDLLPNTSLQMSEITDIFDEDLRLSEYSLPVSIPWTERNRRIFGFAERVENFKGGKTNYYQCDAYEDLWPEIQGGRLNILEKIGKFTYKTGSFSANIQGSKAMFGSKIKYKYLNSLSLGGTLNFSSLFSGVFGAGIDTRMFATQHAKGQFPQLDFFAFAPVAIEGFFDTSRADWTQEFLAKDCVNYPVIDPGNNTWQFGRLSGTQATDGSGQPVYNPDGTPKIIYSTAPVASGSAGYADYRTVPFLKAKYVFRKVFEEFGYTITGDFLTNKDFDDLVIFNQYGLESYGSNNYDYNRTITFANHVPPLLIITFLKGFLNFFGLFPVFSGTNVTIYNRDSEIKNRRVLNVDAACSVDFDSAFQNPDTKNSDGTDIGYRLDYTWDSSDQYYSDRVKDLSTVTDKTLVASVPTLPYLYNLNIGRQLITSDIAYVEADNLYYVVADATTSNVKWEVYSEELNSYITGDGTRSINVEASPLCTYVEANISTGLMEKQNYVGTKQQGTYLNAKGILVNNPFNRQTGALPSSSLSSNGVQTTPLYGLRFFYIRQKLVQNVVVPYTTNYNRDDNNQRTSNYSLAWRGTDGLAAKLHVNWQNMRQNMEFVKTTYAADRKLLNDMDKANCHELQNVLLVPYKIERDIPLKRTLTATLVPL